jgi:hypothetical protein
MMMITILAILIAACGLLAFAVATWFVTKALFRLGDWLAAHFGEL